MTRGQQRKVYDSPINQFKKWQPRLQCRAGRTVWTDIRAFSLMKRQTLLISTWFKRNWIFAREHLGNPNPKIRVLANILLGRLLSAASEIQATQGQKLKSSLSINHLLIILKKHDDSHKRTQILTNEKLLLGDVWVFACKIIEIIKWLWK